MIEQLTGHEPVLVHFGTPDSIPAEVCGTCSDEENDTWVPVTRCPLSAANQLPDGMPCPVGLALMPPCTGCGRRDRMDRWQDPTGSGYQCGHMDCLTETVDGEFE